MHAWARFGNGDQRWQNHRANVHHTLSVHIIQLKALHLRAVDQRRMGRR
jgi:hypothetical protein